MDDTIIEGRDGWRLAKSHDSGKLLIVGKTYGVGNTPCLRCIAQANAGDPDALAAIMLCDDWIMRRLLKGGI